MLKRNVQDAFAAGTSMFGKSFSFDGLRDAVACVKMCPIPVSVFVSLSVCVCAFFFSFFFLSPFLIHFPITSPLTSSCTLQQPGKAP